MDPADKKIFLSTPPGSAWSLVLISPCGAGLEEAAWHADGDLPIPSAEEGSATCLAQGRESLSNLLEGPKWEILVKFCEH